MSPRAKQYCDEFLFLDHAVKNGDSSSEVKQRSKENLNLHNSMSLDEKLEVLTFLTEFVQNNEVR